MKPRSLQAYIPCMGKTHLAVLNLRPSPGQYTFFNMETGLNGRSFWTPGVLSVGKVHAYTHDVL